MRRVLALLLVLALIGLSAPNPASSESAAVHVGASAGSAFGTMIYAPVKATFCILGGLGSGVTAIFSPPTAGRIAMAACGGDWVVSPSVIQGHEKPRFIGDTTPGHTAELR